jgi:hypothetical protein
VLPNSCNSVWLAPHLPRCGNSIFSTTLTTARSAQGSITSLAFGLSPHHCSHPLLPFPTLFTDCLDPCLTPVLHDMFSIHPNPAVSFRLQFVVYAFQSSRGWEIQPAQGWCWIMFLGEHMGKLCIVCGTHLFVLQVYVSSFGKS